MDTNDIKNVIAASNVFKGLQVQCQEYITRLPSGTPVIFNTIKCSQGNGKHWVLCCYDADNNPVYYDSFAQQTPEIVYRYFNSKDIYTFTRQTQEKGTFECGQMCLYAYAVLSQGGISVLEDILGKNKLLNTLTSKHFVNNLSQFKGNPVAVKLLKNDI